MGWDQTWKETRQEEEGTGREEEGEEGGRMGRPSLPLSPCSAFSPASVDIPSSMHDSVSFLGLLMLPFQCPI